MELTENNVQKDKQVADLTEDNRQAKERIAQLQEELTKLREKSARDDEKLQSSNEKIAALQAKVFHLLNNDCVIMYLHYLKLEEQAKKSDAELNTLLLLRQQFDQHVLDMHRWRKLLEVETSVDFLAEVKTPLLEDLAKEGSFDGQFKLLRAKLEDETKDIQKYLHEKEEINKLRLKVWKMHML